MRTGILLATLLLGGCATTATTVERGRFESEATPIIVVAPGLTDRLALMDSYRLNDAREVRVTVAPADESTEEEDDEAPPPASR